MALDHLALCKLLVFGVLQSTERSLRPLWQERRGMCVEFGEEHQALMFSVCVHGEPALHGEKLLWWSGF